MKIPKTLKLPRKIKKELKKGFERRVYSGMLRPIEGQIKPNQKKIIYSGGVVTYTYVPYSGSGTKACKKACSYLRREEVKVTHQKMEDERDRFYSYLCGLAGVSPNYNKTCNIIPVGGII